MMITGHRTRSKFDCYDIVDERDLANAAEKMNTFSSTGHSAEVQTTVEVAENKE